MRSWCEFGSRPASRWNSGHATLSGSRLKRNASHRTSSVSCARLVARSTAGRHGVVDDAPEPPWWIHQRLRISDFLRGQGVNVTLGLPFVRTSPDHGTAFDIAGRGLADPSSTTAALTLAHRLASAEAPPSSVDESPGGEP